MTGHDSESGVTFESVLFRGQYVEVSFTEEQDRGNGITRVTTFIVGHDRCPVELQELMTALREYVDAASVVLRNPPERIGHGA